MCYQIHKLVNSVWNEDEFPVEWKESIVVPIYKKGDKTVVITGAYHICQLLTKCHPKSCCQS